MTQSIEIQNLTLAVIGAIAAAIIGFLKWYPDYRRLKAQLEIKKEDAQLEKDEAVTKKNTEEWELLKTSIQTSVQSVQNTLQLASQMAVMNQNMERQLDIMGGMKSAVDGANENLAKLDTYTRTQLEPIFQLIQAIHKIAETNNVQGKQSLEILQALKTNVDNAITQIKKRETNGDSQPLAPVVTAELKAKPVDLPKASGQ